MAEDDSSSGLSQVTAALRIDAPQPMIVEAPPGLPPPPRPADATAGQAQVVTMDDEDLHAFAEEEVLDHALVLSALRRVVPQGDLRSTRRSLSTWARMEDFLKGWGYHLAHADAWLQLGLLPMEGAEEVSEAVIDRRCRRAVCMLSRADAPDWSEEDRSHAEEARSKLRAAAAACLEALPRIRQQRRRLRAPLVEPWRELGSTALGVVHDTPASEGELVATQLSALLELPAGLAASPRVASVALARDIATAAVRGDNFLPKASGSGLVLWAPTEVSALGRLLSAYARHAPELPGVRPLRLLCPMEVLPECTTADTIMDLTWHPLLGDKWASLVRAREFIPMRMDMVVTSAAGPSQRARGLMVFTIATSGAFAIPRVISVAEPLLAMDRGMTMLVDCSVAHLPLVSRLVEDEGRPWGFTVGATQRSPGSSKLAPRVRFEAAAPPGRATRLDVVLLIRRLRMVVRFPSGTYLASRDIFVDSASQLMDVTSPDALAQFWQLCEEAVFVTPTVVAIRTSTATEVWRGHMDEALQEDAQCAALRLRWRPSRLGGQTWVSPTATAQQLAAHRRSAGRAVSAADLQDTTVEVTVHGELGHNPAELLGYLMRVVSQRTGVALRAAVTADEPGAGVWKPATLGDPSADPGRVRVQLASAVEVRLLAAELHGKAVQLGADLLTIAVISDPLNPLPANLRRGRAAGRPPAPAC